MATAVPLFGISVSIVVCDRQPDADPGMGQVLRTLVDYHLYHGKEEDVAMDEGREKSEFRRPIL